MVMILPVFSGAATQTVYEKELAAFPESYRSYISALQKAHPKWHFIAVDTGLDWKDVVANECVLGRNLIVNTSKPEYIDLTDVDADGKQKIRDGNNWVAASKAAVEYFLDPRNSLTDSYVFMFESLSYISDSSYTTDNIKAILKGTFMAGDFTCPDTGEVMSYADTFMEAGKLSKANPYHLAAKVRIEQGTKGNYLGLGTREGYENIFNFFNIGAYNHDGRTATENGAIYAAATGSYGRPWTNQYKALVGGAQFFASSYINVGQDTIYFEKFNVVYKDKLYKHQYMTNVQGGRSTAVSMKRGYSADVLASELYFKIP